MKYIGILIGRVFDETSQDESLLGTRLKQLRDVRRGAEAAAKRVYVDRMRARLELQLALAKSDPSYFSDIDHVLGVCVVGRNTSGARWTRSSLSAGVSVLDAGSEALTALGFHKYGVYAPRVDALGGRDAPGAVAAAVMASRAAESRVMKFSPLKPADVMADGAIGEFAILLNRSKDALAQDYDVFGAERSRSMLPKIVATLDGLNQSVLSGLLEAHKLAPGVARNLAITEALLSGYPILKLSDFGELESDAPAVSLIYVVMVTMSAKSWRCVCVRVLRGGENICAMFREPIPIGFKAVLFEMLPLVDAANDDVMLTGVYTGRERRTLVPTRFRRVDEHGRACGNDNVRRIFCIASPVRRRYTSGHVCTLFNDVSVRRRFIGFYPLETPVLDLAEAIVQVAVAGLSKSGVVGGTGAVALNNSPTGESRRFLVEQPDGSPPKFEEHAMRVFNDAGSQAASLKVTAERSYFMRRLLGTALVLLYGGFYIDRGGNALLPSGPAGFTYMDCLRAILTEKARRERRVSLWCDSCTCDFKDERLCVCLLMCRLRRKQLLLQPTGGVGAIGSGGAVGGNGGSGGDDGHALVAGGHRQRIWQDSTELLYAPEKYVEPPVVSADADVEPDVAPAARDFSEQIAFNAATLVAALPSLLNKIRDGGVSARTAELTAQSVNKALLHVLAAAQLTQQHVGDAFGHGAALAPPGRSRHEVNAGRAMEGHVAAGGAYARTPHAELQRVLRVVTDARGGDAVESALKYGADYIPQILAAASSGARGGDESDAGSGAPLVSARARS